MDPKSHKTSNKKLNKLLQACFKANIVVRRTGGGHYLIYTPNGEVMTISATPRNNSQIDYMISKLKKKGANI
jgi:hypothetical protein